MSILHDRKELRAGWRLLLFCVLVFIFAYVIHLVVKRLPMPEYPGLHPVGVIVDDAVLLLVALAATAVMARVEHRSFVTYGLPRMRDLFRRMFWRGAAWGLSMSSAIILLIFLGGGYRIHGLNHTGAELAKFASLWLVANLLIGLSEEVLFRGHLFENLRDQWGLTLATLVSSLAFALLHAANPAFGPLPFANLILFGVATALYKARVDNGQLWGVFAIHTLWNWLQQVVFGLPNSGMAGLPENALFTVSPNLGVPDAISGGGFGPEGTLATTLVLLALIAACLRRPERAKTYELKTISD